jgi:cyclopropane fatty-acyl-phospholipid synthase-like methyltransferase
MNINQKSYNLIANKWSSDRHTSFVSQLVIDFAEMVVPEGHILDIGCGTGHPIDTYLIEQGFKVTGIDFTENLLQMAIDRQLPNTSFILCDFFDYNPDEKYDGIIAFDSFFHFPKEKQHTIYSRISQWMLPGAPLLFTHGAKEGEITDSMYGEKFYYSCLDTSAVHTLLKEAGFDVIRTLEYYVERDMDRDLVVFARKKN